MNGSQNIIYKKSTFDLNFQTLYIPSIKTTYKMGYIRSGNLYIPSIKTTYKMGSKQLYATEALAMASAEAKFGRIAIKRGGLTEDDVALDVKYCGVCHSDVHMVRDDFKAVLPTNFPCVPGHEIAGIVTQVLLGNNCWD